MRILRAALIAFVAFATPVLAQDEKLEWRPGFVMPLGIGAHSGIGTWGSRAGVIVGKFAKSADGDTRAIGLLVLGEAADDQFRAIGIGVGGSGGFPLGPVHVLPGIAFRLTLNSAAWNPDLSGYRRKAVGVSAGFTYYLLNYSASLYRELEDSQRAGGWQWRLGFGLGL